MRFTAWLMMAAAAGARTCSGAEGLPGVCGCAAQVPQTLAVSETQNTEGTGGAREQGGQRKYRVNVHVSSKVDVPLNLLWHSEEAATAIYSRIGVQLNWRSGHGRPPSKAVSTCPPESGIRDLWIEIVPHAPDTVNDNALAIAKPYGDSSVRIVVFYDRVESLLQIHARVTVGAIFGHVLAHEIAHVLQGIARHSESGVMRAHWTEDDFMQMGIGGLAFTSEDIVFIRNGFMPKDASPVCFAQ